MPKFEISLLLAISISGALLGADVPKSLRLYVIDCGVLNIPDTSSYQFKPEELATKNMSVACFLISVTGPRTLRIW